MEGPGYGRSENDQGKMCMPSATLYKQLAMRTISFFYKIGI